MTQLTDHDKEKLAAWDSQLNTKIELKILQTDHPETPLFESTIQQLQRSAQKMTLVPEKLDPDNLQLDLPGFQMADNIKFYALPLERELDPFLEGLSWIKTGISPAEKALKAELEKIDIPVHLRLYIALACPHCPAMAKTALMLAAENPNINLEIIDGSMFPQIAAEDKVMSAPTLILDHDFRWTQAVSPEEIMEMILHRDPSMLSARTLRAVLEEGKASWLTDQMVNSNRIFDSFVKLLLHELWSVRLGAMVVVEELAGKAPELSATLCTTLLEQFDAQQIPVKGDMLYAMGETGDSETLEWIQENLPHFDHPDLEDAANDAMETIRERLSS